MSTENSDNPIDILLGSIDLSSVFLASLLEKFFPLLPSYVLFPAIGVGSADAWGLFVRCFVAGIGSVMGALAWYGIGACVGSQRITALVEKYGKWMLLKPAVYARMSASHKRSPFFTTFICQLVPTIRIFQGLAAGVLQIPLWRFVLATALGAQVWIVPLATAGFLLTRHGWTASETGATVLATLVAVEAVVGATMLAIKKRRGARAQTLASISVHP